MRRSERHAMFLHAHPDDESSKGAGTMAKYAKDGARVSVVTFTDGGAGDILNPALAEDQAVRDNLIEVRREEIANALSILGVTDHFDLGYPDSGWVEEFDRSKGDQLADDCFFNAPIDDVLEKLVPIIRETRPQVLVTYDEKGGYPHPDHIRTHDATIAAWRAAADPTVMPDAGEPWRAPKVYYHQTFTYHRLTTMHQACLDAGIESPYAEWLERWEVPPLEVVTTRVDIRDFFGLAREALKAHRTQIDPDGRWFSMPDELAVQTWPWEDYVLALNDVVTPLPEDDLFSGL